MYIQHHHPELAGLEFHQIGALRQLRIGQLPPRGVYHRIAVHAADNGTFRRSGSRHVRQKYPHQRAVRRQRSQPIAVVAQHRQRGQHPRLYIVRQLVAGDGSGRELVRGHGAIRQFWRGDRSRRQLGGGDRQHIAGGKRRAIGSGIGAIRRLGGALQTAQDLLIHPIRRGIHLHRAAVGAFFDQQLADRRFGDDRVGSIPPDHLEPQHTGDRQLLKQRNGHRVTAGDHRLAENGFARRRLKIELHIYHPGGKICRQPYLQRGCLVFLFVSGKLVVAARPDRF